MNGHLKKYGRWGELVEESEILTMKAESLQHSDTKSSRKLHGQAAVLYEEALRLIPPKKFIFEPYAAFIVSAIVLYYKAGNFVAAKRVIGEYGNKVENDYHIGKLEEIGGTIRETNQKKKKK